MHTCRRPATPSLTSSGSSRTAYQRTVHVCLRKVQEPTTPVTDQALSAWRRLLRRRTDISAVVGLAAALATLVAYILAFRAHGLWGFFDSLGRTRRCRSAARERGLARPRPPVTRRGSPVRRARPPQNHPRPARHATPTVVRRTLRPRRQEHPTDLDTHTNRSPQSEMIREALRRHLNTLAAQQDAPAYRARPLTPEQLSLAAAEHRDPAEAARRRARTRHRIR